MHIYLPGIFNDDGTVRFVQMFVSFGLLACKNTTDL